MGRFLINFLKPLGPVIEIDKQSKANEWKKAWKADVIWFSVPRDIVDDMVRGKKLSSKQLLVDICSIKRNIAAVLKKTGAAHLSLHPLHGPYIPISGQKWALVPTDKNSQKHPMTCDIIKYLESKEIKIVEAESENQHDFMMALTLSVPELLSIMIDELVEQYVKDNKAKKPSKEELRKWAIPAFNSIHNTYIHIVDSTSPWLRADLLCKAHGNLLESARKTFKKLGDDLLEKNIKKHLKKQRKYIAGLPQREKENCRSWLERWFVESNKKMFLEEKDYSKPELNIQWSLSREEIFSLRKKSYTVGIHGIAGCFTHESIIRFAEENKINPEIFDFRFLITAENVLKNVQEKKIDVGVFAMANSGSGAYVSSMHAMGRYDFDVLAVYGMEIVQCLMGDPRTDFSKIEQVFGHPQAVSQCKRTFEEKYPQFKLVYGNDNDDTALCARMVKEGKLPRTTATLASQVAAKLYKLKIFAYDMHHDPYNTTTFLLIRKRK